MYKERTDNMRGLFPSPPVLSDESLCLRPLTLSDRNDLHHLVQEEAVYRYLPTFLFEKKYEPADVIRRLYEEGLNDSLILGVFSGSRFCGLAEIYGYRAPIRKASVGYRLLQEEWGKGIAARALGIVVRELLENRQIEIITASTMIENQASAHVLMKNGFALVAHAAEEDWGFAGPTLADKWIR